jgi:hypothetical protein
VHRGIAAAMIARERERPGMWKLTSSAKNV